MYNLDMSTNGTYWGPDEPNDEILLEQAFMFSAYVLGIGFAVQFILYIVVMKILWTKRNDTPFFSRILMIHSSAMCFASFFTTVPVYVTMEEAFIRNRSFPGGIPAYLRAATRLWYNVASLMGLVAGAALSDFILLWRCHVIWSLGLNSKASTKLVMLIPTILTLVTFALGLTWSILGATPLPFLDLKIEPLGLIYFCISVILNVLLTGMIVLRMKSYQTNIEECLGKANAAVYVSSSTIFIESAALYTIVALPLLVTAAIPSPLFQVFLAIASPTQICCSYFIIWRVADGSAWSSKLRQATKPRDSGSILEFNGKLNTLTLTTISRGAEDGFKLQSKGVPGKFDKNIANGVHSIALLGLPKKITSSFDLC